MLFKFSDSKALPQRARARSMFWKSLVYPVLILASFTFFAACSGDGRSNLEALPVQNYLQKPGDFLGNRYLVRAQINEQLKWERGLGRVVAVSVEGSNSRLPVFVPESVGQNLHVGQRYTMEVIIEEGGLIYVEALRKF
ncbi:MAG: hypothetical protein EA353_11500 [Puniceicoccaceae bacterium]|nr:MAG: hypothetical protein EA353_11500 [Puniceicoccaceae bacterium]